MGLTGDRGRRDAAGMSPAVTIETALRAALAGAGQGEVTFARDFQGFPGTVHGGGVAGLFYRVTTPNPPVRLRMELLRGVPTETPLQLTTGSVGSVAQLALGQGDRRLAAAELARGPVLAVDPGPTLDAWGARRSSEEVPATATCLACGTANDLGLGMRFSFDDRFLWCEYAPPDTYRAADGSLHPALVTIALDELGWWLGALAQQECGVTTEVAITVLRPLPFAPLVVIGDRAAIRPDDGPRGRYVRAQGLLLTADGTLLASGEVRFAGSPAYTKRLVEPFLETTPHETLFRVFPSARALVARTRPASQRPT
jgi:hypothetical protein